MKKIISLVLLVSILLVNVQTVTATQISSASPAFLSTTQYQTITSSLQIAQERQLIPELIGADFTDLCIGSPINTYELTSTGLEQTPIIFYPLSINGRLIAFSITDTRHTFTSQITSELTNEINSIASVGDAFVLIYDAQSCYLYDGYYLHHLADSSYRVDTRATFPKFGARAAFTDNEVELCEFEANPFNYITPSTAERTAINQAFYGVAVSHIPQTMTNTCWAAAIAMLGKYYTGISATDTDVVSAHFNIHNINSSTLNYGEEYYDRMRDTLYEYYDKDNDDVDFYHNIETSTVTGGDIRDELIEEQPVMGIFLKDVGEYGLDGYHATVICGIDVVNGYIVLRDPSQSNFVYAEHTNYNGNAYFSYTSPTELVTLYLTTYLYNVE